jgi:outer membrane murein-binding lipoprotein Lpp
MPNDETARAPAPALPARAPGMSSDTKWIIGTVVVLAGLLSAQISGVNAGLNARIDDLNTSVNARIDDVHRRIDDMQADLRELRVLVNELLKADDPAA